MAEYKVTLSALEEASSQISKQSSEYLTAADELRSAADALTAQSFVGEAGEAYSESIQELYAWIAEMSTVVEAFGTVLTEAREIYETADQQSAAQFQ